MNFINFINFTNCLHYRLPPLLPLLLPDELPPDELREGDDELPLLVLVPLLLRVEEGAL